MPPAQPRYSYDDFVTFLSAHLSRPIHPAGSTGCANCGNAMRSGTCLSIASVAQLVERPLRTVGRWSKGGVPEKSADEIAIALSLHPSAIWPEWFDIEDVA